VRQWKYNLLSLLSLTSYRPEKDVHDIFPEEAAFKQVKLRLIFLYMDVENAEIAGAIFLSMS
jgi:hypothetical protein